MNLGTKVTALIMAASRGPDDPMARAFQAEHKCLIKINAIPMLVRVVQTLKVVREIGSIGVSIDTGEALKKIPALDQLVPFKSADSAPKSVAAAISQMSQPFPLLVTTADHPLLTPQMVEYFLRHAQATGADIVAGLAGRTDVENVDRSVKRTYFKFRDGEFSGCNLFYLSSENAMNAVRFWHKVDKQRKRPLALARMFNAVVLIKYLLGRLTLKDGLENMSKLLKVRADAVILPWGEAAIDVDKPEDYKLVTRLLKKRRQKITTT